MAASSALLPILLVDDEQGILFSSSMILLDAVPNRVLTVDDGSKVMPLLESQPVAAVVLDLHMPGLTGQQLLQRIVFEYPQIPVLIMTASNEIETAVECIKNGAFDYLVKPVNSERLVTSVRRALEMGSLRDQVSALKQQMLHGKLKHEEVFAPIITRNKKMLSLFNYLECVAGSGQPVLVCGETGVGKELFARAIHELSGAKGAFVPVNLAGLDDQMFSDTLFGHWKGAFTGADTAREGLIGRAAGGTLFFDEIGDLSIACQVKLLRLLQENEYYPLGSDVAKQSDCRVVVATNRDLNKLTAAGDFRKDLFYRLRAHGCEIPPLRERMEDIPLLFDHFLQATAQAQGKKKPAYTDDLLACLAAYPFPGNVRELQAMVYDAVALHDANLLSLASFRDKMGSRPGSGLAAATIDAEPSRDTQVVFNHFPTMKEAEELLISHALAIAKGKQCTAAALLGMTQQALNNRLVRKKRKL
jgi:DNA-binding NtrC family response regulator